MATSTAQRVGIWVIAVAMIVGTVAGFAAMIFATDNQQRSQDALREWQKEYAEYQKQVTAQSDDAEKRSKALSNKYADVFVGQKSQAKKFKKDDVKKLNVETLKKGTGKTISANTTYMTYYIGFNPKGKIFDSSLDGKKLKAPLIARPGGLISGWSEAMEGLKIGGIYKLSIPSEKAYGSEGAGEDIPANTPLKFIVMPIEILKTYKEPQVTPEILEAYSAGQ